MDRIYIGGDTAVTWSNFVNATTGSPITNAMIEATLYTLDGVEVTSCDLTYDEDLEAYTGSLSTIGNSDMPLVQENVEYELEIEAIVGSTIALKKRRVVAKYDVFD